MAQSLGLVQAGTCDAHAYGSYRSGLLFPDSDLDLALTGTCTRQQDGVEMPLHELTREKQVAMLKALANKLQQQHASGWVGDGRHVIPFSSWPRLMG